MTSMNPPSETSDSLSAHTEPPPQTKQPIFLAMQGGGAKGVIHVGGLIAIQKLPLEIKGVSGTSAGSIVAALVASGYSGKELVDPLERTHIFQELAPKLGYPNPTSLFTPNGWRVLKFIRGIFRPKETIINLLQNSPWKTILCALLLASTLYCGITYSPHTFAILTLLVIAYAITTLLRGLTTVSRVRDMIDKALALKLSEPGSEKIENVTFGDLQKANKIPLKIISTNIQGESLELFCYDRTPNVVVADAVAASICLPIIFKPWKFQFTRETEYTSIPQTGNFIDGGLVSNLPAWPFDEERLLNPECITVALGIDSADDQSKKHWLPAAVNAIVNGTGEIDTRGVGKIVTIRHKTKLGILDFDMDPETVFKEVLVAELNTLEQLKSEIITNPNILTSAANEIRNEMKLLCQKSLGLWHTNAGKYRIRVGICLQKAGSMKSLSIAYSAGYKRSDKDNLSTMPLSEKSLVGTSWLKRHPLLFQGTRQMLRSMHGYEQIWPDIQWVMCIPFVHNTPDERKARACVLVIDSDLPFNSTLPNARKHFERFAVDATAMVRNYNQANKVESFVQGANTCL